MHKLTINNRHYSIKPRFYVVCMTLIVILVSTIIFWKGSNDKPQIMEEVIALPVIEPVLPRYGFTEPDIYLLAQLLCGNKNKSGDGEYDIDFATEINYYEVGKVLSVVMNRVRSNVFPNMVYDVVVQPRQFSVMPYNLVVEPSEIALKTVREWCEAYDNYSSFIQVVPVNHLYFSGDGVINTTRGPIS